MVVDGGAIVLLEAPSRFVDTSARDAHRHYSKRCHSVDWSWLEILVERGGLIAEGLAKIGQGLPKVVEDQAQVVGRCAKFVDGQAKVVEGSELCVDGLEMRVDGLDCSKNYCLVGNRCCSSSLALLCY